jgi:hypothetical protein
LQGRGFPAIFGHETFFGRGDPAPTFLKLKFAISGNQEPWKTITVNILTATWDN